MARRERRRIVWQVLYHYEQHAIEMNLMEQMEYINTQFGDALYRRWTFGDGGRAMGDKIGSRSRPVTFTSLPLFSLFRSFHTLIEGTVSLWSPLDENLKTIQRYLALMCALLSDIESAEGLILNERQKVWVDQLRLVARKGHSLVAAYPKEHRFPFLVRRIIFARDIKYLLNEIIDISDRKKIYGIANIQGGRKELVSLGGGEPEIIVEPNDNSGRGSKENPHAAHRFLFRHITELEREVQVITGEKQLIDAMFRDVQEFEYEKLDGRSKIWVDQMQDIASEIEFLIDECGRGFEPELMLSKTEKQFTFMSTVNKTRKKIKYASRIRETYGLFKHQILRRKTQPPLAVKESRIVGFDEDVEVLMTQLLADQKLRSIISIVGIEGTGKTTLAKLIYNNETVIDAFACRIWISVSPSCTVEQFLAEITRAVTTQIMEGQQDRATTQDSFALTALASRKYLIVIDDIENPHFLDILTEVIPDMSTASRFLLTTRNTTLVPRQAAPIYFVHPLWLLDDENSWILFTTNLNVDVHIHSKRKPTEVEKRNVAKCSGLPLEILKMSYFLSHTDVTEWSSMLEQPIQSQNPWSETPNTNLPSYLRKCLFYLELFPVDFEIPVRRLVVLWVAEGLVHVGEDQEEPPELVAERYLTELIDLNLLQIAKRKANGKVKTCRFPNALREFLKSIESRIPPGTDLDAVPKKSRIRRLADCFEEKDIWHKHIHGNTAAKDYDSLVTYYRSVFSFLSFDTRQGSKPGQDISSFLNLCITSNCLLLLRVLDLEGVYNPNLPKNIAKLTRLRYLGLRWTYLQSLPSSINSLLQLQTLDLKLRHLFLSETHRTRFPPKPKGSSSLSDLQTLWGLFVDEETPVKGGLDKLVNITKLGIACQSISSQREAIESQLHAVSDWIGKLEYLQSLKLKSRDKEGRPSNLQLESLKNHVNLTDVYLLGCLSRTSILFKFPPSLVVLTLSHSKLESDPMQILNYLPNLRSLSLLAESYMGKKLVCNSESFAQLYVLKVWKLEQLEEWIIEEEALPSLRQLEIRLCPGMKMLPNGLRHVNSLLELRLTNMSMEINTDKENVPPNCEVHRDDSAQFEEQFIYNGLSPRKPYGHQ